MEFVNKLIMNRKSFLAKTSVAMSSLVITRDIFARKKDPVFGHGNMQYGLNNQWGKLNPQQHPVNDCHEMVQDSKGRIILLTNETKNNLLFYDKSGKYLSSWGHDFPGAHGLTLTNENGAEFFFITDTAKHQVYKTTIDGKILLTINPPMETGLYKKPEDFVPTEVAVDDNGDFFIADGYGQQYVIQYDRAGKLKGYFGGRGPGDNHLDNAHGIVFDNRNGQHSLLVTDRTRHCFKRFTTEGKLLEVINLPGACVCRPVIRGTHLYAAVLTSPDLGTKGKGFVTILDQTNKVVSNIGGTAPVYEGDKLQPMAQAEPIFVHPHDVCIDNDENIYVAQWASGKVYPYKLTRT